jgi:transposase
VNDGRFDHCGTPLTALAFVLTIGKAERFGSGKQLASYLRLVPLEDSSGNRRRLAPYSCRTDLSFRAGTWRKGTQ